MFKYAVSNWIYGDEPLEETCRRLDREGYAGIELVGEPDRYDPLTVKQLTARHGLEVTSVLSWCIWPMEDRDLAHADPAIRRKAVQYICENIDLAAAVNAPLVIVIPAPSGRAEPHGTHDDAVSWQKAAAREWDFSVEAVKESARYAAQKDITIAVEPINRFETFLVNSTVQGIKFIEQAGEQNIKLHLDTFHMNIEESSTAGAIEKAAGRLVSMHLSDNNRRAVGKGQFDFGQLLTSLRAINFQGPLILEPLPPHPNPFVAGELPEFKSYRDSDLHDSINFLRLTEEAIQGGH